MGRKQDQAAIEAKAAVKFDFTSVGLPEEFLSLLPTDFGARYYVWCDVLNDL